MTKHMQCLSLFAGHEFLNYASDGFNTLHNYRSSAIQELAALWMSVGICSTSVVSANTFPESPVHGRRRWHDLS